MRSIVFKPYLSSNTYQFCISWHTTWIAPVIQVAAILCNIAKWLFGPKVHGIFTRLFYFSVIIMARIGTFISKLLEFEIVMCASNKFQTMITE